MSCSRCSECWPGGLARFGSRRTSGARRCTSRSTSDSTETSRPARSWPSTALRTGWRTDLTPVSCSGAPTWSLRPGASGRRSSPAAGWRGRRGPRPSRALGGLRSLRDKLPPQMRVLVVEDETDLGEVFRDFLSDLGHQPVLVRSAEAALGKLQSDRPDAIILDIHLPGMSGLDFLQLRPVRESGLPIVAVSGVATESQARECLRLGALDFVGKPVPLDRLHDVRTFLEPHAIDRRRDDQARRAERRQSARVRLELPVTLHEYRGASWPGTCVELSVSGMKVNTAAPLSTGRAIKCTFALPDDGGALDVISLVLRAGADGAVLSFVNLPAHQPRQLGEIVRRLAR